MTNKERYKQAFSALQSSQKLSLEVEEMAEFQPLHVQLLYVVQEQRMPQILEGFRRRFRFGCMVQRQRWK